MARDSLIDTRTAVSEAPMNQRPFACCGSVGQSAFDTGELHLYGELVVWRLF